MPQSLKRIMTYVSDRFGFDFLVRQNTIFRKKIQALGKTESIHDAYAGRPVPESPYCRIIRNPVPTSPIQGDVE